VPGTVRAVLPRLTSAEPLNGCSASHKVCSTSGDLPTISCEPLHRSSGEAISHPSRSSAGR